MSTYIVAVKPTNIVLPLTSAGMSFKALAFVDRHGSQLSMADFGTFAFAVVKQGAVWECIKFTNFSYDASGNCTFTIDPNGRKILPKKPYTGSTTGFDFSSGADLVITNDPATMNTFANTANDNTWAGIQTFTIIPQVTSDPTLANELSRKQYVDTKVSKSGNENIDGVKTLSSIPIIPTTTPSLPGHAVSMQYADTKMSKSGDESIAGVKTFTQSPKGPTAVAANDLINKGQVESYIAAGGVDASSTAKGISKLSLNPSSPTNPIAVGDNDPRVPTALVATSSGAADSGKTPKLNSSGVIDSSMIPAPIITYYTAIAGVFTVTIASPAVFTTNNHGLVNGRKVRLTTTGALPTNLTTGVTYFVVNATTNTYQLSLTSGGAAINTSGSQSGVHTCREVFEKSATTTRVNVRVGAAGGAGGASTNNSTAGSGGAAGGTAEKNFLASALATAETIVIGVGGVGTLGGDGTDGSSSSFGASLSATGGAKGAIGGLGGVGGVGSGGDINIPGQGGGAGSTNSSGGAVANQGGSSPFGAGGRSLSATGSDQDGNPGLGYCSGGSGAYRNTTNKTGGPGANGIVIVTEY